MLVKELLLPGLRTIPPEATILEASRLMTEFQIRHLPVSDGKKIIGMLSDRDVLLATNKFPVSGPRGDVYINERRKVSEYMSSPVFKMSETAHLHELVRELLERKLSSVVIEDDNQNDIGIITTEDLLHFLFVSLSSKRKIVRRFVFWISNRFK